MSPLLQVSNITVEFPTSGGSIYAVDDVTFALEQGEVLAIVGESGCGKTMLGLSITGLIPSPGRVTSGRILFEGEEITRLPNRCLRDLRGREIAMIFQEPATALNPSLRVGTQIAEVLTRHEGLQKRRAWEHATELLDLVGVADPARRVRAYPHQLSGGMAQRVAIAMALAARPKVLIADEPTTALDVTVQAALLDLLDRLRRELGMSVLIITHDLGVVANIADRVMVMYAGKCVEEAPVGSLFALPRHRYTVGLLGAALDPERMPTRGGDRLVEIPGLVPTRFAPADRCPFAPRCPAASAICEGEYPESRWFDEGHRAACFHPDSTSASIESEASR